MTASDTDDSGIHAVQVRKRKIINSKNTAATKAKNKKTPE